MLCDEHICMGCDTKLKELVISNKKTKRIISIVRKEDYIKVDDPETLERFSDNNVKTYKLYRDYYKLYK